MREGKLATSPTSTTRETLRQVFTVLTMISDAKDVQRGKVRHT
jgi:hypothetical protein